MQIREKASTPLYHQLADTLRTRILTGSYAADAKIPSEAELQEDTGLSRSTVRKALDMLVDEGLIQKERGKGAFVASDVHSHANDLLFSSFTAMMERQGSTVTTKVVDAAFSAAPGGVASFLHIAAGEDAVKLTRLRYVDDEPFCVETTYLPPRFAELIDETTECSLYQALRERFHELPGRGHKTFEVCYATPAEAFLLDVKRGDALMLVIDFVQDSDGAPLHVSKRVMRTDRAKYVEPI